MGRSGWRNVDRVRADGVRVAGVFEAFGIAQIRGGDFTWADDGTTTFEDWTDDALLRQRLIAGLSAAAAALATLRVGSVAWTGFVPPDGDVRRLPTLAAVEDAQHQHGAAVAAVLECVRSAEHRQDDLAVFVAMAEWTPQLRMAPEHVSSRNQFT